MHYHYLHLAHSCQYLPKNDASKIVLIVTILVHSEGP